MIVSKSPNGFTRIIFGDPDADQQTRLHIWEDWPEPDIHCDRWDITSTVVAGELREDVYEVTDALDGDHILLRQSGLGVDPPEFEEVRRVTISRQVSYRWRAGDTYTRRWPLFHAVRPLTLPTITYFRTGKLIDPRPLVVRRYRRNHTPRWEGRDDA